MNLKSLNLPDRFADTGAWIDDLLVSADLLQAIVELEVLAGDRLVSVQSLDGVLLQDQDVVLESGLAGASESTVRALLKQPSLLLPLQELVMMHGGSYWKNKTDQVSGGPPTTQVASQKRGQERGQGSRSRKWLGAVAALAAAVLIMLAVTQLQLAKPTVAKASWGFAQSGLLESNISESKMLGKLAQASASWHNKVPANREQLAKRLREFNFGCQELLSSDLPQLTANNRRAVHAACTACRREIATQLAALESGSDFATVLKASNAAIDRLTDEIRRS